jgi:hypothetical protein
MLNSEVVMSRSAAREPSVPAYKTEERREWLRIDDRILLEHGLVGEPADGPPSDGPPLSEEAIATAVAKPTLDLLSRAGDSLAGSPLLPWVAKIDWMLEIILKSLAKIQPSSVAIARLTDVNLSAGGLSFVTSRQYERGDVLMLRLILPPFTLIHATAKISRVVPEEGDASHRRVATQFEELRADDQEQIIRHILQVQAERLRGRKPGQ